MHLDDRNAYLSNMRRRAATRHKAESVADSSAADQETARKAADHRSRQTGSGHTYSESSRSSGMLESVS